jgi:putative hydrolase
MKLEADLHIHTTASGHGYSTVKEIVEAAAEKELRLIAITDHGLNMPGAPHWYHFTNMISLPPGNERSGSAAGSGSQYCGYGW